MFKFSIRSEITRKYYERSLRIFLDFIQLEPDAVDIEKKCNDFAKLGKQNPDLVLKVLLFVTIISIVLV